MTVNEFIEAIKAAVPEADRDITNVEMDVEVGNFPSGEEGAEDWIMSGDLRGLEFTSGEGGYRRALWVKVAYT